MSPNRDGRADDTADDGAGTTRWGWTYPTWVLALNHIGQGHKATPTNFSHMDQDCAGKLAKSYFWDRCGGNELPAGCDIMVIDWVWNSGNAAVKVIQHSLGFAEDDIDGVVGPQTIGAVKSTDPARFIDNCYWWRANFLDQLGYQHKFPGLYIRNTACQALALTLI